MLYAYGWAMLHPTRKLFFNLFLTSVSALVALVVGAIEVLSLLEERLGLPGRVTFYRNFPRVQELE